MDRLTTGRRHARAGSVTVTELLVRQASPARCTDSSPPARDDSTEITDLIPVVAPASHRRSSVGGAQFAKLASIGVAGAVLCGAVAVSSLISQQRRENAQADDRPAMQVTGDQALLPDRLDRTLPDTLPDTAPHVPPPPALLPPATKVTSVPGTQAPPATADPAGAPGSTSASADTGGTDAAPPDDLALVRRFYENLPDAPDAAFRLLSPKLLHSSQGEFLRSWSQVVEIEAVDVARHADGVLATVRMRLLGGGGLRIRQLLTVAQSPHRIVGVQLLSAQRN